MRILYLIWSLDLGGAEQVVMHVAQGLDRRRFSPVVGCLTRKGRFAPLLEKAGIPVVSFDKRPKLDWGLLPRLERFLKENAIDLVHSHLFTANLWGRLAARRAGKPVVVTEHSVDTWKSPFHVWLDKGLKPLTTHWIFVSQQVRRFYERRLGPLGRASVIYNGIPLPVISRPQSAASSRVWPMTLGTVGRLAPEKEQVRFIELVGSLHREGVAVRGLIVGDGPQRPALEKSVAAHGLQGIVEFAGFVSDMESCWSKIDLLCLTSSREGLPLTLLEAMGHGIPVVTTSVGGVRECVADGVEGAVVPFGDWGNFRTQVRRLVEDPALRGRWGQAGRRRVEQQFSRERMVAEHETLYQQLACP